MKTKLYVAFKDTSVPTIPIKKIKESINFVIKKGDSLSVSYNPQNDLFVVNKQGNDEVFQKTFDDTTLLVTILPSYN